MIGRSTSEYIFIRLSITCLRLIAPLSILDVAVRYIGGEWVYSRWLGYYACIEFAFYLFVYLPRSYYLQRDAKHPPPLSKEDRQSLFARCFSCVHDIELATGWFYFAHSLTLQRENVVDWILWAFFSSPRTGFVEEWEEEIEEYIKTIEILLGRKLEEGRNEDLGCIKVTLDPVSSLHRPLVWYLVVGLIDCYTSLYLTAHGFTHYALHRWFCYFPVRFTSTLWPRSPHPKLGYWYRPHRSKSRKPIVFFHGIGIGLWPYTSFLIDFIKRDPDVGIIAFEILPISMRISSPPLTRPAMLSALKLILAHHDITTFVLCGHSYGTVIAAHILRSPELSSQVSASFLIDPIPFLLHLPSVAYNFVYRLPRTANEWQLWYFASRDPDIARALARHFFWAECILWQEDIVGHRLGVVLCGRDQILDAREVKSYLTGKSDNDCPRWTSDDGLLDILWYPALDHSQVFDTSQTRKTMVDLLEAYVDF